MPAQVDTAREAHTASANRSCHRVQTAAEFAAPCTRTIGGRSSMTSGNFDRTAIIGMACPSIGVLDDTELTGDHAPAPERRADRTVAVLREVDGVFDPFAVEAAAA